MQPVRRWLGLDTFKLLIALILLVLWIILMLQGTPAPAAPVVTEVTTEEVVAVAPTEVPPTEVPPTEAPTAEPPTPLPPTQAPTAAPTATEAPATQAPTVVVTATQASATPEATATATAAFVAAPPSGDCTLALPTRLKVGDRARVTTNLNMRSSPEITKNLLTTHLTGVVLEIVGGPVCVPFEDGAYLWWQVLAPDGATGWSAEGSITGRFYFLEKVE